MCDTVQYLEYSTIPGARYSTWITGPLLHVVPENQYMYSTVMYLGYFAVPGVWYIILNSAFTVQYSTVPGVWCGHWSTVHYLV